MRVDCDAPPAGRSGLNLSLMAFFMRGLAIYLAEEARTYQF
jgi:hypothetical protein